MRLDAEHSEKQATAGHIEPKRRSVFVLFTSSVLILEAILIFCATLASWGLMQRFFDRDGQRYSLIAADESLRSVVLLLGLSLMLLLFIAAAMVRRPRGAIYGSAMQVLVVAFGIVLIPMFVLGIFFSGLWWYAVREGRRIDREKTEREHSLETSRSGTV